MWVLERKREEDIKKRKREKARKQARKGKGEKKKEKERGSEKKFSFEAYAHHLPTVLSPHPLPIGLGCTF